MNSPAYLTAREAADEAATQATIERERKKTRAAFVRCAVGVAAFWWWVNVSIHRELMEDRP